MIALKCIIFVYLIPKSYEVESQLLVEANIGMIRGVRSSDNYSMYMGIPYAAVDRKNPFGLAVPYPKFNSVFKANDDTTMCPQFLEFNETLVGTLDCLNLNIYVPDSAAINKLPILVWVHGGGFDHGFSGRYLYGPKYLVRHDIIVITINYRVGVYGFMCLHIPEVPGNAGLKDQVLAFEWIRDNIEAFGGDPGKVTIYGMSASAIAVDVHYLFAEGNFFDKIIMHSGSAMNPNTVGHPDTKAALKLASHFGFETKNNKDALNFLAKVDALKVISASKYLDINVGLCVEKKFGGVKSLISDIPFNVMARNASNKSVLVAYNRDELESFFARMYPESFPQLRSVIRKDLKNYFRMDPASLDKYEALVRHFYMGDQSFTEKIRPNLGRYASDLQYTHPAMRTMRRYVKNGCKRVYHFVFSYCGDRNFVKSRFDLMHLDIVVHADEVGYLFDVSYMGKPSAKDQLAIDRITTLWANFVKFGNPTPQETELLPVVWKPATEETIPFLELGSKVRVGQEHYHDRVAFWDLFYELNWEAQNDEPYIKFRYNGNVHLKSISVVTLSGVCVVLLSYVVHSIFIEFYEAFIKI